MDGSQMIGGLTSADAEERLAAVLALENWLGALLESGLTSDQLAHQVEQADPRLLEKLVGALGDEHKGVQVTAATCLQFLAHQTPLVLPRLREAMAPAARDGLAAAPASRRAWNAAIICARMKLWFPEMGPALTAALGAQDRDVRWAAAHALLALGRDHGAAVDAALGALGALGAGARKMAAYCLGAMGQYAPVEGALAGALADPERDVRRAAILALDKLPALSAGTLVQIQALEADPDLMVRRTATAVAAKWASA